MSERGKNRGLTWAQPQGAGNRGANSVPGRWGRADSPFTLRRARWSTSSRTSLCLLATGKARRYHAAPGPRGAKDTPARKPDGAADCWPAAEAALASLSRCRMSVLNTCERPGATRRALHADARANGSGTICAARGAAGRPSPAGAGCLTWRPCGGGGWPRPQRWDSGLLRADPPSRCAASRVTALPRGAPQVASVATPPATPDLSRQSPRLVAVRFAPHRDFEAAPRHKRCTRTRRHPPSRCAFRMGKPAFVLRALGGQAGDVSSTEGGPALPKRARRGGRFAQSTAKPSQVPIEAGIARGQTTEATRLWPMSVEAAGLERWRAHW